ncbi:hypothetical protein TSST111916_00045 [Tsukamurella strandjordii]
MAAPVAPSKVLPCAGHSSASPSDAATVVPLCVQAALKATYFPAEGCATTYGVTPAITTALPTGTWAAGTFALPPGPDSPGRAAVVAALACFVATQSGERLEQRPAMARMREQIAAHETQGNATFYWSLAVLVLGIAVWAGSSPTVRGRVPGAAVLSGRAGTVVLGVLATAAAAAVIVGVVAAGHSGATMVWSGI